MMKTFSRILVGLCVIGGAILLVLATLGASRLGWKTADDEAAKPATSIELPASPVSIQEVAFEDKIEITDSYPGVIEPFERFSLGFEIGGRVVTLGVNSSDEPLDDGDRVEKGQLLAKLDARVLHAHVEEIEAQIKETKARQGEANARRAEADADWTRLQEVQETNPEAITEATRDQTEMDLKVANSQLDVIAAQASMLDAQLAIAKKALEDADLVSPVSGVISRRLVNPGESVTPHQHAFEVLIVNEVLLLVGVPEAYVGEIRRGQPVHVQMLARNRFRRERPNHDGVVYRVAQTADETTGLFGVEVLIDNSEGLLRPGQIGRGHIVVRNDVAGYRIPRTAAVKRQGFTLIFAVDDTDVARAVVLEDWIEQGDNLIVSGLPDGLQTIVVRGQHRLVDSQPVQVIVPDTANSTPPTAD
jgi:membrane fusion protein, multidrug efflux system